VVVPRRELDARLVAEARSWGAEVHEGLTLTALVESDGTVTATCRDAAEQTVEFRARWVIAADGMWSATRRLLGGTPPGYRGDWHGFRQYFSSVSTRAQQELFVSFEADILPGYFWSFPLADGRANVGFGIQRPGTGLPTKVARVQAMGSIWQDILQRPHIVEFLGRDAQPEEPHRAWPIPARIAAIDLHHGRVLFVGDAAAACDPMTGEGIGQALQTGLYAATAIAQSATTGVAPGLRYEQMVRRSLLPDHRLAHLLASALGHRKGARAAVAVVDINDWTRRNFGRWLFEDYPRAALASPARWSAMRTRSSGAKGMPPWEERLLR
jgi:flavin-dependent dehydrogenase